jgi:hypothetical protein
VKILKSCLGSFVEWFLLVGNSEARQVTNDGQRLFVPPSGSDSIKNSPFFLLHSPT